MYIYIYCKGVSVPGHTQYSTGNNYEQFAVSDFTLGKWVGLDDLQKCFVTSTILWFCSVILLWDPNLYIFFSNFKSAFTYVLQWIKLTKLTCFFIEKECIYVSYWNEATPIFEGKLCDFLPHNENEGEEYRVFKTNQFLKKKLLNVISGEQPIKFWKITKYTSEYIIYYLLFFLVGLWKVTLLINNSLFFEVHAWVLPKQTYWFWLFFWHIPRPRHFFWTCKESPSASRSGSRQVAPAVFWVPHHSKG